MLSWSSSVQLQWMRSVYCMWAVEELTWGCVCSWFVGCWSLLFQEYGWWKLPPISIPVPCGEFRLIGTWKISITWVLCSFLELWRPAVTCSPGFTVSDNGEDVYLYVACPGKPKDLFSPSICCSGCSKYIYIFFICWGLGVRMKNHRAGCAQQSLKASIWHWFSHLCMGCQNWRHRHQTGPVYSDREKDMRNRYWLEWKMVIDKKQMLSELFFCWKRVSTVGCLFSCLWQNLVKVVMIFPLKFTLWSLFF